MPRPTNPYEPPNTDCQKKQYLPFPDWYEHQQKTDWSGILLILIILSSLSLIAKIVLTFTS